MEQNHTGIMNIILSVKLLHLRILNGKETHVHALMCGRYGIGNDARVFAIK